MFVSIGIFLQTLIFYCSDAVDVVVVCVLNFKTVSLEIQKKSC